MYNGKQWNINYDRYTNMNYEIIRSNNTNFNFWWPLRFQRGRWWKERHWLSTLLNLRSILHPQMILDTVVRDPWPGSASLMKMFTMIIAPYNEKWMNASTQTNMDGVYSIGRPIAIMWFPKIMGKYMSQPSWSHL